MRVCKVNTINKKNKKKINNFLNCELKILLDNASPCCYVLIFDKS